MNTKETNYSKLIGYEELDLYKKLAQEAAKETEGYDFLTEETSVGESAFVSWSKSNPDFGIATVTEGLGTKNIVAEDVYRLTGNANVFECVSFDTVAMIVNDLITVGSLPEVILQHFAVGHADWMKDQKRVRATINGWKLACIASGARWGGGETPALQKIIHPDYPEMSGSSWGSLTRKQYLNGKNIKPGDKIIIVKSSSIHANGISAARKTAEKLPKSYATEITKGATFGDLILIPTINYVKLMRAFRVYDIPLHYAVNITGHGWRKFMRANEKFEYIITTIPEPQPVFDVIEQVQGTQHNKMYDDFNMGAGFAIYVSPEFVGPALEVCKSFDYEAFCAGEISEANEKSVIIEPLQTILTADQLAIR